MKNKVYIWYICKHVLWYCYLATLRQKAPLLCIKFCLITSNFAIIFDETKLASYFVIKIFGQRRRDKSSSNVNGNA